MERGCRASGWACEKYERAGQHESQCLTCGHSASCHQKQKHIDAEMLRLMKEAQMNEAKKDIPRGLSNGGMCRHDIMLCDG